MKPVHQEVKATLLRRLQQLPLDARLPSDRELAREFNVAFLTINRVMNDLMREGYVVRRARRGTFLASRERQVAAQAPAAAGRGCILFAQPSYYSHHFFRHARLAEELAVRHRVRLLEYKLTPESTPERLLAYAREQDGLSGLIVMPTMAMTTPAALRQLAELGRPVVLVSSQADVGKLANLHVLDADWAAVGRLAAETLLRAGHRRIAWVNHEVGRSDLIARGMRAALKANGQRGADLLTVGRGIAEWSDAREAGYRLTQRLLDEGGATAAYFDSIAGVRGASRALWERGLAAPRRLSLIATGNQSGEEDYFTPPLTTIDADWEAEMGRAYALALGQPAPGSWTTPLQLRQRASIAAPDAS
jgi:LacI family transcriptional regulator